MEEETGRQPAGGLGVNRWGMVRQAGKPRAATNSVVRLFARAIRHTPVKALGAMVVGAALIVPASHIRLSGPDQSTPVQAGSVTLPVTRLPVTRMIPTSNIDARGSLPPSPERNFQLVRLERLAAGTDFSQPPILPTPPILPPPETRQIYGLSPSLRPWTMSRALRL